MEKSNPRFIKSSLEKVPDLSRTNPKEFEQEKREKIENVINNANPRYKAKLKGVQFRIDRSLSRYKNPIVRMNKMVEFFWEGVSTFEKILQGEFLDNSTRTSAKIIPFSQKRK